MDAMDANDRKFVLVNDGWGNNTEGLCSVNDLLEISPDVPLEITHQWIGKDYVAIVVVGELEEKSDDDRDNEFTTLREGEVVAVQQGFEYAQAW